MRSPTDLACLNDAKLQLHCSSMLRKIYGQDSIKISSAVLLEWSLTVLTIFDSLHLSTLAVDTRVSVSLRVSNEASVPNSADKQLEFRHVLTRVGAT